MSFATLEEAWGGLGHAKQSAQVTEPEPSDSVYGRNGAPIMDDIVKLYTADKPTLSAADTKQEKQAMEEPVRAPSRQVAEARADTRIELKPKIRKQDDYSDNDSDDGRVTRNMGNDKQDRQIIELAAYVLSGIMLIFVFESFITIGSNLRGRGYY